jgi:hypothetical protein
LGDQVLDAVAHPGGNIKIAGESGDMGITEAFQNLKVEHQIAMGGDTPSSHHATKCTTLREVLYLDFLEKRYDNLMQLRPRLLETVLVNISSVLVVAGWKEHTTLLEARNGYILRISQDMSYAYIGMHSHLVMVGRDKFD